MTAAALPVVLRRLRHDQRHFTRVPKPDQTVRQFRRPVKRLNLIPQMSQLAYRTRESIGTAHEPDVVPHDVLNRLRVTLNQRRIRFIFQTTLIPPWNIFEPCGCTIAIAERSVDLQRGSISPNESFQKRRGSETICAVNAGATDLTDRVQIANRRTRPLVNQHASTEIVCSRNNGHRLA